MFVGGSDGAERLRQLELIIWGYAHAVEVHGISDVGADLLQRLATRLRSERGWSMSCGAIEAIIEHTSDGDEAWRLFWSLVHDERDRAQ